MTFTEEDMKVAEQSNSGLLNYFRALYWRRMIVSRGTSFKFFSTGGRVILLPVFLRNILSAKITAWVDTPIRIALPVWTMNCWVALMGANRAHNLPLRK